MPCIGVQLSMSYILLSLFTVSVDFFFTFFLIFFHIFFDTKMYLVVQASPALACVCVCMCVYTAWACNSTSPDVDILHVPLELPVIAAVFFSTFFLHFYSPTCIWRYWEACIGMQLHLYICMYVCVCMYIYI